MSEQLQRGKSKKKKKHYEWVKKCLQVEEEEGEVEPKFTRTAAKKGEPESGSKLAVSMGASDPVVERRDEKVVDPTVGKEDVEDDDCDDEEDECCEEGKEEKGTVQMDENPQSETRISKLQTVNQLGHLEIVVDRNTNAFAQTSSPLPSQPTPSFRPIPQQPLASLNSTACTNRISLLLFALHMVVAIAAVGFFGFKAVQGIVSNRNRGKRHKEIVVLEFWLPQVLGSAVLSLLLGCIWQKSIRKWPDRMVSVILWSSFGITFATSMLLLSFSMVSTTIGVGVVALIFSVCDGLYACWVTPRIKFASKILKKSLEPAKKFPDLHYPCYWMTVVAFLWISIWSFSIVGALNFYFPPLTILAMVLSLAWTAEVMRNIVNLTISRVIALYYLRGMQANTQFNFQRVISRSLGSAAMGSLFVPGIEALRIVARALNLLEGEDEFMFSCAHCCLRVMESVFRYGNSWAFVHIAAYGRGFVTASQSTWALFEREKMEPIVDSDITSSICFLAGVTSGCISVIASASWTFATHRECTATVSLLAFFVGYLMTRISMALPQACVSAHYVCYAENPRSPAFNESRDLISKQVILLKELRDTAGETRRRPGLRLG